jgi:hypothetical protein
VTPTDVQGSSSQRVIELQNISGEMLTFRVVQTIYDKKNATVEVVTSATVELSGLKYNPKTTTNKSNSRVETTNYNVADGIIQEVKLHGCDERLTTIRKGSYFWSKDIEVCSNMKLEAGQRYIVEKRNGAVALREIPIPKDRGTM